MVPAGIIADGEVDGRILSTGRRLHAVHEKTLIGVALELGHFKTAERPGCRLRGASCHDVAPLGRACGAGWLKVMVGVKPKESTLGLVRTAYRPNLPKHKAMAWKVAD